MAIRPTLLMGRHADLNANTPRIPLTAKAASIRNNNNETSASESGAVQCEENGRDEKSGCTTLHCPAKRSRFDYWAVITHSDPEDPKQYIAFAKPLVIGLPD